MKNDLNYFDDLENHRDLKPELIPVLGRGGPKTGINTRFIETFPNFSIDLRIFLCFLVNFLISMNFWCLFFGESLRTLILLLFLEIL